MTMSQLSSRRGLRGFTMVELMVVIGIIALLVSLILPAFGQMIQRARSTACAANLSSIGLAVSQAATDNNNTYPEINQGGGQIYPAGSAAKDLYDTLSPYGITQKSLQCPTDIAAGTASSYAVYGSSYEWNPITRGSSPPPPVSVMSWGTRAFSSTPATTSTSWPARSATRKSSISSGTTSCPTRPAGKAQGRPARRAHPAAAGRRFPQERAEGRQRDGRPAHGRLDARPLRPRAGRPADRRNSFCPAPFR
jgi:prepilin-type N-terminal cleavage/methylation domain-containing protein